MHRSAIAPLALLGSAVALHQTTTIFLPGFGQQPLVASIAGSDDTATTYAIKCAPGTSSDECGVGAGFTLIEGPTTAHFEMIDGDASYFSFAEDCTFTGSTTAVCTETATGSGANSPGTRVAKFEGAELAAQMVVITVTAGEVSSTASASTAATATAPTVTATTGTAGSTGSASAGGSTTGTSTGAASASAGSSSSVSTGGLPRITGNVEWAMGGAAVAMALAGL